MSTKATREAVTEDPTAGKRYSVKWRDVSLTLTRAEAWDLVGEIVKAVLAGNEIQARHAWLAEAESRARKRALRDAEQDLRQRVRAVGEDVYAKTMQWKPVRDHFEWLGNRRME